MFSKGQRVEQRRRKTKEHHRYGIVLDPIPNRNNGSILIRSDSGGQSHWNSNTAWEIVPVFRGVCGECLGECPEDDYLCKACKP